MSDPQSSSTTHTHIPKEATPHAPDTIGAEVQPEAAIPNLQHAHLLTARYVTQLQRQMGNRATQRMIARKPQVNQTGLPDALKSQVEQTSGLSLDDVRVHHDSDKPAELHAQAYTQGAEIHVAPGAGEHLAHEAWHVVQQKQGRVSPTADMGNAPVNDEVGLEREAEAFASTGVAPLVAQTSAPMGGQSIARMPIQFYDPKGVASFFDRETIPELKVHIGEDTFAYFVKQTPSEFKNIMPFFQNQRLDTNAAIVNAEAQGEFLKAHVNAPANLALAQETLTTLGYVPTNAEAVFGLLQPYYGTPRYGYFQGALARVGNDPVAATPQFTFMGLHLASDEEFTLADEVLTNAGYDPVVATPMYVYLAKYTAMGESQLKAAKRILASKGNDPVVAEQTMTATKDYGYLESVAQGAQTMTEATAEADIQDQLSEQAKERDKFEKSYKKETSYELSSTLDRKKAKDKRTQLGKIFGVSTSKADGPFRTDVEEARNAKVEEFDQAPIAIEGERGNLEAKYGLEIKNALTPLYAFDEAEAAANGCMTTAGTDIDLLKKLVAWTADGLTAKIALITLQSTITAIKSLDVDKGKAIIAHHGAYLKLAGLSAEKAFAVIKILATGAGGDGDLDASETERLIGLLTPLTADKIHALIVLLEPTLLSSGMLDIADKLKVDGTKIDTFVRKYVPGITAKLLLKLVSNLAPLSDTGINDFVALLSPSLSHEKVVDLTTKLSPLDGTQQTAFIPKLQTVSDPLTGKQIAELVYAMEGTPGDKMDAMVTQFTALGDDTGKKIAKRVSDMRGGSGLKVGGKNSTDQTELDGERLLTGDEIAIRADQVTTGTLTSDDLMKYPHSNINPVGRDEDLLWKDCDPTVSRHINEKPADLEIRKKLAFNQICKIGGVDKQVAQQVMMENNGQKPRDMDTASVEDGRSGGHTADRHVIGSGQINTLLKLQNRANGDVNLPPCPGIAGAYASMGASQAGMHAAMQKAHTNGLWPNIRKQLIRKLEYEIRIAAAVNGHVARRNQLRNDTPSRVYLPVKGDNVKGGFSTFHSWPEI